MPTRCHLQTLAPEDFTGLVELFLCPTARQYLGGPITAELARSRSIDWITRSPNESIWAIRDGLDSSMIGYVLLDSHHNGNDIEVSYALLPAYWGRGFATEALLQVLHLAFYDLGLPKLVAETQAKNTRSTSLLRRIGMLEEMRVTRFGEEQIIFSILSPSHPKTEAGGGNSAALRASP